MRDHGGNIDAAQARWGGDGWIDLSTGINRVAWPIPTLCATVWSGLPTQRAMNDLLSAARIAYFTTSPLVALAGAQAAIQLYPRLATPGTARVLGPTYNEHAASLQAQNWRVQTVTTLAALEGADLAVVVNPNNPDGANHAPEVLRNLTSKVGQLIVDESFADPVPTLSLAPDPGAALVLRSFGKFYGLAGLRLGFAIGPAPLIARLEELAGPWGVSGPALAIGTAALADTNWARQTTARLTVETCRLDAAAAAAGWRLAGGGHLFRLYETPDAEGAQNQLAQARIWTRRFPRHRHWLRLGLPGGPDEWVRVEAALSGQG